MATYFFRAGSLRIVSQAPSITEMIFGLGLEDYMVGCTQYCDYPPKLATMIASGKVDNSLDWFYPSAEAIVALSPTMVLLDAGVSAQVQLATSLQSQGIATYLVSRGNRIHEIESTIEQLGNLFAWVTLSQSVTAAQNLVSLMETKINNVQERVSGQPVVRVLYCVWIDFSANTLYTCGNQTFISEIIQKAGGINIYYNNEQSWPSDNLYLEKAAYTDPDVIIISDHFAFLDPVEVLSDMGKSPLLKHTPAYQNGEVYFIQGQADNLFSRPGPRVAEGVELLAHILFPSLYNATFPDPYHVINDANYKN
ncbi:MAG: ABC transporter substrate-binding protein, partial [Candidatus Freyarchaeota archaeon]